MTTLPPLEPQSPAAASRTATVPGLLVAALAAALACGVQRVVPATSPLLVAILLGVAAAHLRSLPERFQPGLQVAGKRVLRLGIVVLGLQLSLREVVGLGWGTLGVVVAVVGLGIAFTLACGRRLGVPEPLRLLIACGFSICGAAAVAAVAGASESDEEDVAAAVGLVVLFGTGMIGLCPLLLPALGLPLREQGLVAGGSIHEVGQVVAVGGILGGSALAVAVVVKLARVLMLAPVIVTLVVRQRRAGRANQRESLPPVVPLFVAGFVGMAVVRTVLPVPEPVLALGGLVETFLLSAAMFALGTGLRVGLLKQTGARAVALAGLSTVGVFLVAYVGVLVTT